METKAFIYPSPKLRIIKRPKFTLVVYSLYVCYLPLGGSRCSGGKKVKTCAAVKTSSVRTVTCISSLSFCIFIAAAVD